MGFLCPAYTIGTLLFLTLLFLTCSLDASALPNTSNTTEPQAAIAAERARRLHILKRVLIAEYLTFHKKHRGSHRRLIVRFIEPHPGIGDRFTALFYAYVSAALSNRILLIDWRYPFAINRFFLSNSGAQFQYMPADSRFERERTLVDCAQECRAGNLSMLGGDAWTMIENRPVPMHVRDIVGLGYKHAKEFERARRLIELWGDGRQMGDRAMPGDGAVFSEIFRTVLRISPEFERFIRRHAGGLLKRQYVAVHARLGEGVRESGPRFWERGRWEEFAECLGRRAVRMGRRLGGDGSLFLASDSPGFRRIFQKAVGKVGGWEGDVVFGGWRTKHLARMVSGDKRDWELFRLSVLEFILLGRGVGMVSGESRFASAGSLVGGMEEREVVKIGQC